MLKRADEATDVSIEINLASLPPLLCRRDLGVIVFVSMLTL